MNAEREHTPSRFEMSDGHVLVCCFEWIVKVCSCRSEKPAIGVIMRFSCAPLPSQGLLFLLLRSGFLNLCFLLQKGSAFT